MKQIIVIPSLKPNDRLPALIDDLREAFAKRTEEAFPVVIIDDGSGSDYASYFDACKEKGCTVLTHEKNKGKGAALKTAAAWIRETCGDDSGMITADADGQHLPEDILKVADAMRKHPDALVLGSRDFGEGTPWKSLVGNRITSFFFFITTGRRCRDTQTGLRGIPPALMELALTVEGERYEYEMNFLMDAALAAPFETVTIRTVYFDDNKGSHFHPVRDAARVYSRFIRFFLASVAGFVVDILLFMLLMRILPLSVDAWSLRMPDALQNFFSSEAGESAARIMTATVLARICSGTVNFLLNKFYSFRSKKKAAKEARRYVSLFVCQMIVSAVCTSLLASVLHRATPAKIIVDVILFFISYRIQRAWVFR